MPGIQCDDRLPAKLITGNAHKHVSLTDEMACRSFSGNMAA